MKKAIILAIAAIVGINAYADRRNAITFVKSKSRLEWTVKAGLSVDYFAGMLKGYDDEDKESINAGTHAGFAVDFGFNKFIKNTNLYWGMELGFGTRGFSYDVTHYSYGNNEVERESVSCYDVKFSPFTIGYRFSLGEAFQIDPHLGMFASCDIAHNDNWEYMDGDKIFDAGIQFGVGFWYKIVSLDFMYQRGFIPAFYRYNGYGYDEEYRGCTSNFLLRLGVKF